MIDKKELIEELLDCVADATDTETQITSLTMAGMLMNQVLDEALTIPAVVGRSEQLKAFLLFIQENAPNYRTKQLKPDQVIKAYLESL